GTWGSLAGAEVRRDPAGFRCVFWKNRSPLAFYGGAADPGALGGGFSPDRISSETVGGRHGTLEGVFSGKSLERKRPCGLSGTISERRIRRLRLFSGCTGERR